MKIDALFRHAALKLAMMVVPLSLAATLICSSARAATPATDPLPPSNYLRYVADDNGDGGATLQASVVRFENAEGVMVDLVAAVHIADRSFYQALDESFNDYDAVLYELVAPKDMLAPATRGSTFRKLGATTKPATRRSSSMAWVGMLQRSLRDTLKLSFQLDEIDYKRPNFVHADLDAETFAELQSKRGESMLSLMLDSMMKQMSNPDAMAAQPGLFDILAALNSPDKARQLKLMMGRQFQQIDDQFESDSVLVGERNKAAMKVLNQELSAKKGRHFAIFYGAAHLKLMAATLTEEMGFHQVGPPFWRVAWDMTPSPTTAASRPSGR